MKKFFFAIAILFSLSASSQTIVSVSPYSGYTVKLSYPRLITNVKLDAPAYAVIISIDAQWGFLKQKGDAYAGVMTPNTANAYKVFDVSGLAPGSHKIFVDVYINPRTIVDSQEITFYVTN